MTFNYELVNKIISAIFPLPEDFGNIVYEESCEEFVDQELVQEFLSSVDSEAEIHYGVSKMVIKSPNLWGVVLKIPFNGCYEVKEEEYDWYNNAEWIPFMKAPCEDPSDYCLAEYRKYQKLKKIGLDCFVTKTLPYKTIDGIRIFIQEEATPESESCKAHNPSLDSKNLAKSYRQKYGCCHMDTNWIGLCLDLYGKEKTERFLSYCDIVDRDILDDAHYGNYGYRDNGSPCLIDYSNYKELQED